MKTFKEYLIEHRTKKKPGESYDERGYLKSSPVRSLRWLEKTKKSISSHVIGGGSPHSYRGQLLRQRYDDHRDYLVQYHPNKWKEYCDKFDLSIEHTARDVFA